MARPRATRANAFAALLALVLGFAVATQVRSTQAQGLESLRQSDLVGILDNVTQQSTRLDDDARELQATRDQLRQRRPATRRRRSRPPRSAWTRCASSPVRRPPRAPGSG